MTNGRLKGSFFEIASSRFQQGECLLTTLLICLRRDPLPEVQKVERFLGLRPHFSAAHFWFPEGSSFPCFRPTEDAEPECMGKEKGRAHPTLAPETYTYLKQYFDPIMAEFYQNTGIKYEL